MSTPEELAFTARAKAHIDICNEQSASAHAEDVALSALYAAARYGAYLCINGNGSGEQMAARRAEATLMFEEQFRQMFHDCYDEFASNFEVAK
ncbi:DUF3144 domain-containing protein [Asticcacaulis sp.]|jgi:sulfite reductase beta subunit-like hemoprotein|uniref:DUF3144 domain-containing protein n=1 Tax=Asticcacaulis sp. TaxID=1872648 RepID=UPI002D19AD46|nr:DUF3144 domain-containing protein [Asticcacaulis sp.]HTM80808.1 DUF3144 domain-containing protein [Asticcacaulis sp.]